MKVGDTVRILPFPIADKKQGSKYPYQMQHTIGKPGIIVHADPHNKLPYKVDFYTNYRFYEEFWFFEEKYLELIENEFLTVTYLEWILERNYND